MLDHSRRVLKPVRWLSGVLEKSSDLMVLGGGMIGLALVIGVILVGLHERQTSVRSISPTQAADDAAYR